MPVVIWLKVPALLLSLNSCCRSNARIFKPDKNWHPYIIRSHFYYWNKQLLTCFPTFFLKQQFGCLLLSTFNINCLNGQSHSGIQLSLRPIIKPSHDSSTCTLSTHCLVSSCIILYNIILYNNKLHYYKVVDSCI